MEFTVDAFLNHDYNHSLAYYFVYLLATGVKDVGSQRLFLQSMLLDLGVCPFRVQGQSDARPAPQLPWGKPMQSWPSGTTEQQAKQPAQDLIKRFTFVAQGERELLHTLQHSGVVLCGCLRYEDPYDPLFGTKNFALENDAWQPPDFETKRHAYQVECNACKKLPQGQKAFDLCRRCYRRRYCSKVIQLTIVAQ